MSDRAILINQAGPLPISTTIKTGSNGPSMLYLSGSVWTAESAGQIGIAVLIDGTKVGEAVIWSNEPTEHRAVVPVFIEITLDKAWPSETEMPSYTVELSPLNSSTLSDLNDWFQLSLVA
jgi:hypothetical protein